MSTPTIRFTCGMSCSEIRPFQQYVLVSLTKSCIVGTGIPREVRTDPAGKVQDSGALLVEEGGPLAAQGLDLLAAHLDPLGVHLLEVMRVFVEVLLVGGREVMALCCVALLLLRVIGHVKLRVVCVEN